MPTSRDNAILLKGADITNVQYVGGSFQITPGQPSTLPPYITQNEDEATWLVRIDCGRSGSSSIATSFNNIAGTPNHSWTEPYMEQPYVSTDKPSDLNFYFALDLTFRGVSATQRVYFGQGHALEMFNNWWIAGSQVLNTYPGYSLIAFFYMSSSHTYMVSSIEGASPTFNFVLNT